MAPLYADVTFHAIEPRIIDDDLLRNIINEQGPKGEAGRLLAHDGIILGEVTSIRLEFLNILVVDHLWMMTSLVKLDLSNNIIEKIENIDTLVNLKELNLSFNSIEKIENLDALVNLKILTLFENCVLKIENLDSLNYLTILSLGNNNISYWNDIIYLRRFKALRSLNMAGNPCCSDNPEGESKRNKSIKNANEEKDIDFGDGKNIHPKCRNEEFRKYALALLPQLHFYEFCLVNEAEREKGQQEYRHKLLFMKEEEEKQKLTLYKLQEEKDLLNKEIAAWVCNLRGSELYDDIFNNDLCGKALTTLDENIQEIYNEFHMQFLGVTAKLYYIGLAKKEERDEEERQFVECLEKAKEATRKEGEGIMTELLAEKIQYFAEMAHLVKCKEGSVGNPETNPENGPSYQKGTLLEMSTAGEDVGEDLLIDQIQLLNHDFNDLCQRTWEHLMDLETYQYEQIEEALASFERNISDQVTTFIETAQVHFANCRELESWFHERITNAAPRYFTATRARIAAHNVKTVTNEESDLVERSTSIAEEEKYSCPTVPKILEQCLASKDVLQNILISSHDIHLQIIDAREDKLISEAKSWLKEKVDECTRNEVKGNRERLNEITAVVTLLREEFEELQASSITLPMLADMEIMDG